ncbi:MAG: light-harvesting antenna LH1, beta subunit [Beijerinckiaceae bacterium]
MMENKRSTITGLNEEEAKEFHSLFVTSMIGYIVVAVIAHFLVWQWRPWFPSVKGYALLDSVTSMFG